MRVVYPHPNSQGDWHHWVCRILGHNWSQVGLVSLGRHVCNRCGAAGSTHPRNMGQV